MLNKFKKGEVGIPSYLTNDPYAKGSILLDRIKNGQTIKKAIYSSHLTVSLKHLISSIDHGRN